MVMSESVAPALRGRLFLFSWLLLLAVPCIALCQDSFPSWFRQLPEVPEGYYLSTGYAGRFVNRTLGKQVALDMAIKNLYRQKGIKLRFRLEEIADGRLRITHPSYEMIYKPDLILEEGKDFRIVDSLYTDKAYFVLIVSPPDIELAVRGEALTGWGSRPKWVDGIVSKDNLPCGIGLVSRYTSWTRAWQDADAFAYFDLARTVALNVESIHTMISRGFVIESKIMKQELDVTIRDCVVTARWYDRDRDIYYSLCTPKEKKPVVHTDPPH